MEKARGLISKTGNFSSIPSFPLSETLYDQSALINRIEPGRLQPLFESTPINI